MPTYQYRCQDCGSDLEVKQSFTDPALTECPSCQGTLRKVFGAAGVVFKGSGFYRNDARASSQASSSSASTAESTGTKKADSSSSTSAGASNSSSS